MVAHSLVSNGLDYLMLVTYGGPLVARRIAFDGTILGETPLISNAIGSNAAVVPTGVGYAVVWSAGGIVYSTAITPAGTANVPQEILRIDSVPPGWSGGYEHPALAWDGHQALLVMSRVERETVLFPGLSRTHARLEAYRIQGDGSLASSPPVVLASSDSELGQPLVASSGSEFLIAQTDRRFIVTSTGVTSFVTKPISAADLIWDGTAYVLARDQALIERIGARRLDVRRHIPEIGGERRRRLQLNW